MTHVVECQNVKTSTSHAMFATIVNKNCGYKMCRKCCIKQEGGSGGEVCNIKSHRVKHLFMSPKKMSKGE